MDAQPRILQHVAGVVGVSELGRKEGVKLRAELFDQRSSCHLVGLLISHHELLESHRGG
jgi:hypothetical protein